MALSFIKRVFTFGEQPAEEKTNEVAQAAEHAALEKSVVEGDLPVSPVDPVSDVEIETAGGPSADAVAEETPAILPGAEETSELGVVPLSLLEAEAAAETVSSPNAETPPSVLPDISPSRGEITDAAVSPSSDIGAADAASSVGQGASSQPISPPVGEMPGRAEGGISPSAPAVSEPVLPKGFSTAKPEPAPAPVAPQPKLSWFQRLKAGLARTSSQLTGQITALFTKRKLDDETLEELEDLLIQADLGVETAMRISGALSSERYGKDVTGADVSRIMAGEIAKVLTPVAKPLALDLNHKPHVILVVGVNGTGKTTTIGKLAAKLSGSGLKVMLAAGDTFRAAAIEQLKIWADRTGSQFIGTKLGADAAGLAYDAYEQARANKSDVLIIDTAGRLQNRAELMAELEKIVRVLGKLDPDAPHTVLQTLDATTGQNALNQVEIFRNVAGVSGLIMTKLDGTARGGILVAIAAKHKLPVYFIGVGEGVDDLEPFAAEDFAQAIAGIAD
ncbi:signal recognition particle-docking protein FtsY [Neorhizobium alkalisoli]|uniref:Signal recognition particle receptor FtsY n=1 Tax=Neorhizobium alkalisoli TaxID=528178 RepID=A0A561QIK8_9HYPH|nr:signal recognition particle-docking protein FtsY [Neorhizobium alkalisoli]TWF50203.1 signal recognition particle-docking protein FtsY [Neorhizobium alkalisoli]